MKIQNNLHSPLPSTHFHTQNQRHSKKEIHQEEKKDFFLQNNALIELKEINQKIAQIQKLKNSYAKIQKELAESHNLAIQIHQNPQNKQALMQKIQNLQQKLSPIVQEANQHKLLSSKIQNSSQDLQENFKSLKGFLSKEQNFLEDTLQQESQKIDKMFSHQEVVAFDEKKLQAKLFKNAHNTKLLNPSFHKLVI